MSNIILIHGSWHGGWCWDAVKEMLENVGHHVYAPTLPGMDYKIRPTPRDVGLTEHVKFIKNIIEEGNLSDVILIGHSYGGMIITGLAIQIPDRIKKIIYLDAFLPSPGQSLFDISAPERVEAMQKSLVDEDGKTKEQGGNEPFLLPIRDVRFFGIEDPILADSIKGKLVPTSVKTFTDKIDLGVISDHIEKFYIRCTGFPVSERFELKAKGLKYSCYRLDVGHDVMLINPKMLLELLNKIL